MRSICDKDKTSGSISHATIDMQHTNFRCNDGHAIANATQTTRYKTSDITIQANTRMDYTNASDIFSNYTRTPNDRDNLHESLTIYVDEKNVLQHFSTPEFI